MRNTNRTVSFAAAALLVTAVVVRLPSLASPPMDFAAMRQHHSALIARARFLNQHPTAAPDWQRETANDYVAQATIPEPQVIEGLDAVLYGLTGAERLSLARYLSLALWLAGALCLRAAARRLSGEAAGLIALTVSLFLPYSIGASSSIQSDTLAFALMSAALWAAMGTGVFGTKLVPNTPVPILGLVILAMAAGFVRAMSLLWLAPIAGIAIWRASQAPPAARLLRITGALALTATPAIGYAAYRWTSDHLFAERVGATFAPALLVSTSFWRGWAGQAWHAFGPLLPLAAVGTVAIIVARGRARAFLVALWAGYAAYGVLFNLHISTHPYYQTLAVPMIVLSIAAAAGLVLSPDSRPQESYASVGLVALLLTAWCVWAGAVRSSPRADDARVFAEIGDRVSHSRRAIVLGEDWGVPLRYYGGISGRYWPAVFEVDMYRPLGANGIAIEDAAARFKKFSEALGGAEYFIVTDAEELARQPDLQEILSSYPIVERTDRFTIFDLRSRPAGISGGTMISTWPSRS